MEANNPDMRRVEQRVAQAFFGDGLFECLTGLMLILMGALVATPMLANMLYLPWLLLTVIFPAARKKYVTPRTGYVASPGGRSRLRLTIGLAVLFLAGIFFLLIGSGNRQSLWVQMPMDALRWLIEHAPLAAGLGLAIFWGYLGWRTRLARMLAYGVVSLAAAIVLSLVRLRLGLRVMALLVGLGAAMGIWGLVVFMGFLRSHPLPQGQEPDSA